MTDEVKTEVKEKKPAIELVKKHFQGQLSGKLNHYHVEEWGLDMYYRPITTLKMESKIVELSSQGKSVEALVESIIQKALDESGKPMFTAYDKSALMNEADPAVVLKVAKVVNGGDLPTVDEAEKNS